MSLFSYALGYAATLLFLAIISLNVYHALGLWALVLWLACSYGLPDRESRNIVFYGFLLVSAILNIIDWI